MPVDMTLLAGDLSAETSDLAGTVRGLDPAGWLTPTPAVGWTIADQFSHLAFFDDAAVMSAIDPRRFDAELGSAPADAIDPDLVAERYRALTGQEVLAWFGSARRRLIEVFGGLDPASRLPWFGLSMSAASSLTARIMETWAHGQDVADALGITRTASGRLRHVAHIGVRALPFSFMTNKITVPAEPVRVELTAEDGQLWSWGPADAANRVTGPALDFCLLVTKRRHRDDTSVVASGPVADRWLSIAQAFAGPPGTGRQPAGRPRRAAGSSP